jgi:5S rRNA maturation endonuclease (ribonuclease M5)
MFKLETAQRITKEFLFHHIKPEQIFEFYLGVHITKGLFCSPDVVRVDKKPTCSFYKNSRGNLIYKDFAGPSFDAIGLVEYLFHCSYYKALQIIANDFGLVKIEKLEKNIQKIEYSGKEIEVTNKAKIEVEIKDFSEKELSWWKTFGISPDTLKKFKIYSIKSVFLNGNYFTSSTNTNPIYGYYGGKDSDDNELWRIYMPLKRSYRFLSNWSATKLQGSKQIPKSGDFIVITKSLKDVMSLYEFGIPSLAPNSENLFLTEAQYNKLKIKFKQIYIFYDNDLPGIRAMNKIRKQFKDLQVIFIPKKYKVKDFSDLVKKYGVARTYNIVDEWLVKRV